MRSIKAGVLLFVFLAVSVLLSPVACDGGCDACQLTIGSLIRTREENPGAMHRTLAGEGADRDSVCRHAGNHFAKACNSLIGLLGEDTLLQAILDKDSVHACSTICTDGVTQHSEDLDGADELLVNDEEDSGDLLFVLDGALKPDSEDKKANEKTTKDDREKTVESPLQTNVNEDEVKRLRDALAKSELETKLKVAEAVKSATDKVEENTKKAVEIATEKAVEEAKEKWRHAWRTRQWPVNVKVPAVASKLACTADSEGRIAFRNNDFYGCKQHCVNVCEQCNCKQEETSVWDDEGKVYKRVKREVCEQCCTQKCAPEWLNFANCSRVCKSCDCKEEHGIKICQQCCNEECKPTWHPDPI